MGPVAKGPSTFALNTKQESLLTFCAAAYSLSCSEALHLFAIFLFWSQKSSPQTGTLPGRTFLYIPKRRRKFVTWCIIHIWWLQETCQLLSHRRVTQHSRINDKKENECIRWYLWYLAGAWIRATSFSIGAISPQGEQGLGVVGRFGFQSDDLFGQYRSNIMVCGSALATYNKQFIVKKNTVREQNLMKRIGLSELPKWMLIARTNKSYLHG